MQRQLHETHAERVIMLYWAKQQQQQQQQQQHPSGGFEPACARVAAAVAADIVQ
jgi:hypothetical protein